MGILGKYFLIFAFGASVISIIVGIIRIGRKRNLLSTFSLWAAFATAVSIIISGIILGYSLMSNDYSIQYVIDKISIDTPLIYRITALWAGQAGSLLFWSVVLSILFLVVLMQKKKLDIFVFRYVVVFLMINQLFFLIVNNFVFNPFEPALHSVEDGKGFNPILQNIGMVLHPPILYFGLAGFVIPFAYSIAGLIASKYNLALIRINKLWMQVLWLLMTIGILMGMAWSYVELGWGGYWAWDPIENASLLPWLIATAYIHTIVIEEKYRLFKRWNPFLILLTFVMSLFCTFLARSGFIFSVHAFSSSLLGILFIIFIGIVIIALTFVFIRAYSKLKSIAKMKSLLSQEGLIVINNFLVLSLAFAILWGVLFPVISEIITGNRIALGARFYNSITVPLGMLLLFFIGVENLLSMRKNGTKVKLIYLILPVLAGLLTVGILVALGIGNVYAIISLSMITFVFVTIVFEYIRDVIDSIKSKSETFLIAIYRSVIKKRRRYCHHLIHFGVLLLFLGFTGSAFDLGFDGTLHKGDTYKFDKFLVKLQDISTNQGPNYISVESKFLVEKEDKVIGEVFPEKRYYSKFESIAVSEVGIISNVLRDFYIISKDIDTKSQRVQFEVLIKPLVIWIWIGGCIIIFGSIISIFLKKENG
ncbi:MAG: heme lyase CcmF/NrfE family subunit [Candidatus Marinimicrobia bacterium]|nr:heme lyase CcmF/NrfE family subunit [Candidatus Neomarinimicrobiota bacterium]